MKALLASRLGSLRFFSSSSSLRLKNRVPEYQKLFQEDNGLPVHLKGGVMDTILYHITTALGIVGSAYALFGLFRLSMPKKNN